MRILRKFPRWAAPLVSMLALAPLVLADTVTLKSGEKIEGKVITETPQEVTIEFNVTASIKDSRTVPMAEVAKVDKAGPDVAAYEAIKNVKPGPNSVAADTYDNLINAVQSFLTAHPTSQYTGEVKKNLDDLSAEKKRVEGGELKINNNWITKEVAEKERYQITAQLTFAQMQFQDGRGDLVGALNTFELLEKNFPGARAFPEAVTLARSTLSKLRGLTERNLVAAKQQAQERAAGNALLSPTEKSTVLAAQQQELKRNDALLEAAQRTRNKWPQFSGSYEKGLTYLQTNITAEARRLETLPVDAMRQSIQLATKAAQDLEQKDVAAAEPGLRDARQKWAANEMVKRLEAQLTVAKAEAKATPVATPVATVAPTPAKVTATPAAQKAPVATTQEEAEPFFTPAKLVIGVVLLALVGFLVRGFLKVKKKASEVLE